MKKKLKKFVVRSTKSETNKKEINNYNKRDLNKKFELTNNINKNNKKNSIRMQNITRRKLILTTIYLVQKVKRSN